MSNLIRLTSTLPRIYLFDCGMFVIQSHACLCKYLQKVNHYRMITQTLIATDVIILKFYPSVRRLYENGNRFIALPDIGQDILKTRMASNRLSINGTGQEAE